MSTVMDQAANLTIVSTEMVDAARVSAIGAEEGSQPLALQPDVRRTEAVSERELRAAIAARIGASRYGLWFGEGVRLRLKGDSFHIEVPNAFFREWIETHFSNDLIEVCRAVSGRPLQLTFALAGTAGTRAEQTDHPNPIEASKHVASPKPAGPIASSLHAAEAGSDRHDEFELGRRQSVRMLTNFVVGGGNRLAHAAVVELVQTLGRTFNPLLIHGGVGLGKTHLLEAAAVALRARMPSWNVLQMTAETFTNGFLEAMRADALPTFRARFRGADALVVDDVHFLAAKRATQIEFLHTFNSLCDAGRPIVLAADLHPRSIPRLTDELVTRFLGGLVVRLETPDIETRSSLVRTKAAARGIELPEAVVAHIADRIRASIRELEGAINSLLATATLTGQRIDLDLARDVLSDSIRAASPASTLNDIARGINRVFDLDSETLCSDSRARSVALPRMLAMYLARKHTGASYCEIGRYFGDRNHSTVIAAEKKVRGWINDDRCPVNLAGFEHATDLVLAVERSMAH